MKFPDIIYKFRNWCDNNHKKLLLENELYTPSVNQINDPFDCLIKYDYSIIEKEGFSDRFINMIFEEFGNKLNELGFNIHNLKNSSNLNLLSEIIELKKYYDSKFQKNREKHLGVISFSKCWKNILMWSHYSDSHKGFCVGFDTKKLKDSGYFDNGGEVIYQSNYPEVDPFDTGNNKIVQVFYHKSQNWEYEEEFRMTRLFGYHSDEDKFNKQKLLIFENNFISEVIIGLKTPIEHQNEIIRICKEKNIPIYKIEDIPYKFEVNRKQIFQP